MSLHLEPSNELQNCPVLLELSAYTPNRQYVSVEVGTSGFHSVLFSVNTRVVF